MINIKSVSFTEFLLYLFMEIFVSVKPAMERTELDVLKKKYY